MEDKDHHRSRRYYDIDKFRDVYMETLRTRKGIGRVWARFTWHIDSVQGFFVAMLGPTIAFGIVILTVVGVWFGPLAFLGIFGGLIGGLGFVLERKVGRSLQFGDYSLWKRMLAQAAAFGLVLGVLFVMVFLASHRPF